MPSPSAVALRRHVTRLTLGSLSLVGGALAIVAVSPVVPPDPALHDHAPLGLAWGRLLTGAVTVGMLFAALWFSHNPSEVWARGRAQVRLWTLLVCTLFGWLNGVLVAALFAPLVFLQEDPWPSGSSLAFALTLYPLLGGAMGATLGAFISVPLGALYGAVAMFPIGRLHQLRERPSLEGAALALRAVGGTTFAAGLFATVIAVGLVVSEEVRDPVHPLLPALLALLGGLTFAVGERRRRGLLRARRTRPADGWLRVPREALEESGLDDLPRTHLEVPDPAPAVLVRIVGGRSYREAERRIPWALTD